MILGLSSADGGMTVDLWKVSSLDCRRPPWYRSLMRHLSRYQQSTRKPHTGHCRLCYQLYHTSLSHTPELSANCKATPALLFPAKRNQKPALAPGCYGAGEAKGISGNSLQQQLRSFSPPTPSSGAFYAAALKRKTSCLLGKPCLKSLFHLWRSEADLQA